MNDKSVLETALYSKHLAAGATMGEEGRWRVPMRYGDAIAEVRCARQTASIFDISHVARFRIRGDGALDLVERLCTADAARQEDDTARYTLLCNERGGIVDHGWLMRAENFWLLCTESVTREKTWQHIREMAADFDVKIDDQTERTTHMLLTGPKARGMLDGVLPVKPGSMARGEIKVGSLMVARYIAARIGGCNEWCLEAVLPNMVATQAWRFITAKAGANVFSPGGMTARDVLRIESGLCRYGHELNETIDPATADLRWAVSLDHDFLGADAIAQTLDKTPARQRVGLIFPPSVTAIPRQGAVVCDSEAEIGNVTSGTYSPTLDRVIAMAYVAADACEPGRELAVRSGDRPEPAVVATFPICRSGP